MNSHVTTLCIYHAVVCILETVTLENIPSYLDIHLKTKDACKIVLCFCQKQPLASWVCFNSWLLQGTMFSTGVAVQHQGLRVCSVMLTSSPSNVLQNVSILGSARTCYVDLKDGFSPFSHWRPLYI